MSSAPGGGRRRKPPPSLMPPPSPDKDDQPGGAAACRTTVVPSLGSAHAPRQALGPADQLGAERAGRAGMHDPLEGRRVPGDREVGHFPRAGVNLVTDSRPMW